MVQDTVRWYRAPLVVGSMSTYRSVQGDAKKNAVWAGGEQLRAVSSLPSTGLLSVGSIQRVKPIRLPR